MRVSDSAYGLGPAWRQRRQDSDFESALNRVNAGGLADRRPVASTPGDDQLVDTLMTVPVKPGAYLPTATKDDDSDEPRPTIDVRV